jgi:hypothetical protein
MKKVESVKYCTWTDHDCPYINDMEIKTCSRCKEERDKKKNRLA